MWITIYKYRNFNYKYREITVHYCTKLQYTKNKKGNSIFSIWNQHSREGATSGIEWENKRKRAGELESKIANSNGRNLTHTTTGKTIHPVKTTFNPPDGRLTLSIPG